MKDTKSISDLKQAIKEQELDVNYYVQQAESIIRELTKPGVSSRSYVYEKIRHLRELEEF